MIDHDVPPGKLDHCQISGSKDLHLVIDLEVYQQEHGHASVNQDAPLAKKGPTPPPS